jgi:hypothetical protein
MSVVAIHNPSLSQSEIVSLKARDINQVNSLLYGKERSAGAQAEGRAAPGITSSLSL